MFVVVGDVPEVPGGDIWDATAAAFSSASTFGRGTPFESLSPSTASRDLVAAGVIGGECIEETRGL